MKWKRQYNSLPFGLLSTTLFLLLGIFFSWKSRNAPIGDYANYYYASHMWLQGQFDEGIYDVFTFNQDVNLLSAEPAFVNYTPVPPLSVLAYLPFALISDTRISKLVFNLLGLFLFCLAYFRLIRKLELSGTWWLLILPFICFFPLLNNFHQGQSYLFILFFLIEGFCSWNDGKEETAALLWSISAALKLFPAILLLYLLVEKDLKSFFLTIVFSATLSVLFPFCFFPTVTQSYFLEIAPRLFRGEIIDPFATLFQSGRAFLNKAFVLDEHLNPRPLADLPRLAFIGHLAFQALVLTLVTLLIQEDKFNSFARFALALLAGLLITGYGSSYSLMLLFPALLALPLCLGNNTAWLAFGWLLAAIAANTPVYLLGGLPWMLQFPRLYALLVLLALMAWRVRPMARPVTIALIFLFFTGNGFISPAVFPTEGRYYLPDGRYGIIHNYQPQKGELKLWHNNGQGSQLSSFTNSDSIYFHPGLKVVKGQVYWNGWRVTASASRKKQPAFLNENYILYLSDEGRGVGFYTLRKIKIPWALER